MKPFSVAIVGGGVAAVEGLLRLHRLAGDAVAPTLIAPNEDFTLRALSVGEPFALGPRHRHPIHDLVRDTGAEWERDKLAWVDLDGQIVHTDGGHEIAYDALLLAIGGVVTPAFEHATTFRDDQADELLRGIVEDLEEGYTKRVAFIAPDGPMWPLPLYELALMTADRAAGAGMDDAEVVVVTPEPRPLETFGAAAADAAAKLLAERGVTFHSSRAVAVPAPGRVELDGGSVEIVADRVVALPRLGGPSIRGIAGAGDHGFLPIDEHCRVRGAGERVFAAGDATDLPVKHGGISSQQADTAAAAIARLAGIDVEAAPFRPVIRGMLLTGRQPLYMTARMVGGGSFESEVSEQPLWPSGDKVVAEELGRYLARHGGD